MKKLLMAIAVLGALATGAHASCSNTYAEFVIAPTNRVGANYVNQTAINDANPVAAYWGCPAQTPTTRFIKQFVTNGTVRDQINVIYQGCPFSQTTGTYC
ncbi:MAG TPA: hypothetical protein VNI01_15385 [Elusimicrobiota bacterium]|jgi:hypothetical protein|nr:hypothetical protein [Elusimicrobiota bacterium]